MIALIISNFFTSNAQDIFMITRRKTKIVGKKKKRYLNGRKKLKTAVIKWSYTKYYKVWKS